jgi:hypothetical protein
MLRHIGEDEIADHSRAGRRARRRPDHARDLGASPARRIRQRHPQASNWNSGWYSCGAADARDETTIRPSLAKRFLDTSKARGRRSDGSGRIQTYLEELKTTQRYSIYSAEAPLHPILHLDRAVATWKREDAVRPASSTPPITAVTATTCGMSSGRNGVRPPIIAAGINLLGPLGRCTARHGRDPHPPQQPRSALLDHAEGHVAELLRKHDSSSIEGGRVWRRAQEPEDRPDAGRPPGRHPARAPCRRRSALPRPQDHVPGARASLAQRAFSRSLAEMVRYAVGYRSRAFVTFGRFHSAASSGIAPCRPPSDTQ